MYHRGQKFFLKYIYIYIGLGFCPVHLMHAHHSRLSLPQVHKKIKKTILASDDPKAYPGIDTKNLI